MSDLNCVKIREKFWKVLEAEENNESLGVSELCASITNNSQIKDIIKVKFNSYLSNRISAVI